MTKEEKQIGLELQAYIDSVKDMTIKEIAIKHLKKYHLPKFFAGLLVKFSYPLLLAKDYKLDELEKENTELQQKWLDESYEKAKCIKSLDDKNKEIDYLSKQIQKLKIELDTPESVVLDKLDEAREIIRNWLQWANDDIESLKFQDLVDKAEQFLKEE